MGAYKSLDFHWFRQGETHVLSVIFSQ